MNILVSLLLAALIGAGAGDAGPVSGRIVGPDGKPIVARVFLEPGIEGGLLETHSGADGGFRFDSVPVGLAGVFGVAEGMGYSGQSVTVSGTDGVAGLTVALKPAGTVSGKVTDAKGKPVSGAEITRVALLGTTKVSIPLDKLKAFGVTVPVSAEDGAFAVSGMPEGGAVALKVNHPLFAQEAVSDIAVGTQDVHIALYNGVGVQGEVRARDENVPVANATVIIKNAQPPHDTVLTRTNPTGTFTARLKPGVYLCQASSLNLRSPGWQQLILKGETDEQRITLFAGYVGSVHGLVCEAASGTPLAGAQLTVTCLGNTAAVATTGASGTYAFSAVAGENVVRLQAPPGYLPPENNALKVTVAKGVDLEVPTFWLSKLPTYKVQIVDADMQPVPGVVVSLIRPTQFGWRITDTQGFVTLDIGTVPADGLIVGMAEHVTRPEGALFAIKAQQADAKVQLFPLASVRGTVVGDKQKGLPGVPVGAAFANEGGGAEVLFWRTVTHPDGSFAWDSVAPQVPLRCIASANGVAAASQPFTAETGASASAGAITLAAATGGTSLYGQPLKWDEAPVIAGTLPDKTTRAGKPAVVVYCSQQEAAMTIEALGVVQKTLTPGAVTVAAIVDGAYKGDSSGVPVLTGHAPGVATTYVVDGAGNVALETFGMPPLRALQHAETK